MPRPIALHAPAAQPLPVPTPGPLGDILAPLGLRLDYRTACHPRGGRRAARVFRVVIDGDRDRVTCKGCLR